MRLVIRAYLSMLKEEGELDALLPDLLLSMGIVPFSRPQKGARQYGVDVAAVGKDPDDDETQKLFLITIKRGDISRSDWDEGPQTVRPSLNEILDVYILNHVPSKHKSLPKKVILCCGGDLKQQVQQNWASFMTKHEKPGEIEFNLWDGDKLAALIEDHFLDEFLFPESARKHMRKTLALVGDNDYDSSDFYALLEDLLFGSDFLDRGGATAHNRLLKALRIANLSLSIVFHWAREEGNLRPAYLAGERTVLRMWDCLRKHELLADKKTMGEWVKVFRTFEGAARYYFQKLQTHCHVRDGLSGYPADEVEYPLRVFELIGIIGILGLSLVWLHVVTENDRKDESFLNEAKVVGHSLAALIRNNPPATIPLYDGHAIEICIGLLLLCRTDHQKDAARWVKDLFLYIDAAYKFGTRFPIASDSYDDLLDLEIEDGKPKEELMNLSTILPMLAEWCVILDLPAVYQAMRKQIEETFSRTNLQQWYPDKDTEEHLYKRNASETGATECSIHLPETIQALRDRIRRIHNHTYDHFLDPHQLSCISRGCPVIGLIASRHFRTPVIPDFWQSLIVEEEPKSGS